jgi:CHAT domain-containing protein
VNAEATAEELTPDRAVALVNALIAEGEAHNARAESAEAARCFAQALALAESARLPVDAGYLNLMRLTINALTASGQTSRARELLPSFATALRGVNGADDQEALQVTALMFDIYPGRLPGESVMAATIAALEEAVAARQAKVGAGARETLEAQILLATALHRDGKYEQVGQLVDPLAPLAEANGLTEQAFRLRALHIEAEAARLYPDDYARKYVALLDVAATTVGLDHTTAVEYASRLGRHYAGSRRFAEAAPLLERSLSAIEQRSSGDSSELMYALAAMGQVKIGLGDNAAGLTLYRRSVEIAKRLFQDGSLDMLNAIRPLGEAEFAAGEYDAAEQSFLDVVQISEQATPVLTPYFKSDLAEVYFAQGRYGDALDLITRVIAEAPENTIQTFIQRYAAIAARAMLHLPNKATSAVGVARIAAGIARDERARPTTIFMGAAREQRNRDPDRAHYARFADAAWSAAQADPAKLDGLRAEAFTALQEAISSKADRELARMAARRQASRSEAGLGPLAQEREILTDKWASLSGAIANSFQVDDAGGRALRTSLTAELAEVEARLDAIDAELSAKYPNYFALIEPIPVDATAIRTRLGPDEALALVVPTEFGTHVMLATREEVAWHRSDLNASAINEIVQRLRWDLGASINAPQSLQQQWETETLDWERPGFDRTRSNQLYRELFGPLTADFADKGRLYVIPGGALTGLPFSVLVTAPPQGGDDDPAALRETRWLGFEHALVHLPSVQALVQLQEDADGASSRPSGANFFGVGDPLLDGAAREREPRRGGPARSAENIFVGGRRSADGFIVDQQGLRSLKSLPGTARELESLRQAFTAGSAQVLLGEAATETAVRTRDLSEVDVLAFATHGITASVESGFGEAGLVLTPPTEPSGADDGYLAESEVASLRLDADWVILSACNTATGDASDGLSGLSRSFLFAGAHSLLASHWPVDDAVAPKLTVRTVELEAQGNGRAEAFQQAMHEVIWDTSYDRGFNSRAHPYFWAPFVLIGASDSATSN